MDGKDGLRVCLDADLTAAAFYMPANAAIYDAMMVLHARGEPVEEMSILSELGRQGKVQAVGGPGYLSEITDKIRSSMHLRRYAGIVRDRHHLRRLIESQTRILEDAWAGNEQAVAMAKESIVAIAASAEKVQAPKLQMWGPDQFASYDGTAEEKRSRREQCLKNLFQ
jgi:replicative DNA helicase